MRSRDWSSDVCSSDLEDAGEVVHGSPEAGPVGRLVAEHGEELGGEGVVDDVELHGGAVIGRRRGHPGMMAAMDRPTLAAMIDHTLLRPEATAEEVVALCVEATELGVAAVCVSPSMLPITAGMGQGIARSEEHTSELQSLMR